MILTRRKFLAYSVVGTVGLWRSPAVLFEPSESVALYRVTASMLRVRKTPDSGAGETARLFKDDLIQGYGITGKNGRQPGWVETFAGYVPGGYLQPVQYSLHSAKADFPNPALAEVSVPFTQAYRKINHGWEEINRLYYGSTHWIAALEAGPDNGEWYRIEDWYGRNYHVRAEHLAILAPDELTPLHTNVKRLEKWIEVSISEQQLIAYENGNPVLDTYISSGLPLNRELKPDELPTETPYGDFFITVKSASRPMGSKELSNRSDSGALPGVPWVCFFDKNGYSLHGTYWHNNFGAKMSHGCVNMRTEDARWIYRWAEPYYQPAGNEKEVTGWGIRIRISE